VEFSLINLFFILFCVCFLVYTRLAVQNERQPRNTATIKPESLRDLDQSKVLRDHSHSLVGIFG
jgi:hypothetical protein